MKSVDNGCNCCRLIFILYNIYLKIIMKKYMNEYQLTMVATVVN